MFMQIMYHLNIAQISSQEIQTIRSLTLVENFISTFAIYNYGIRLKMRHYFQTRSNLNLRNDWH